MQDLGYQLLDLWYCVFILSTGVVFMLYARHVYSDWKTHGKPAQYKWFMRLLVAYCVFIALWHLAYGITKTLFWLVMTLP